jgi:hypothetical protein
MRDELLTALPQLSDDESVSTRNLFAELNARSAPDLNTWLAQIVRKPAAQAVYSEEEAFDPKPKPQPFYRTQWQHSIATSTILGQA